MLAVGPFGLGPFELMLILAIVVLVFGVGKMADIGGALGRSIREFRRASKEPDDLLSESSAEGAPAATTQATQPACSKCGARISAQSKFCAECGTPIQAPVS